MENIKKIMLSLDDTNKIKRMVVVLEDEIIRYNDKDLSSLDLKKIYSKYIVILKEQYIDELKGLTNEEKVNKLADLGKIERNEDNLIVNFTEYDDPMKFIVTYEDGTTKLVERKDDKEEYYSEYEKILQSICRTYDIPMVNLEETKSKLKQLGLYNRDNEEIDLLDEDTDVKKVDTIEEVEKEHKIKNFVVNHKFLTTVCGLVTLVLVCTGLKGCSNKKENKEDASDNTVIEMEMPQYTEKPEFEFIPEEYVPVETESPIETELPVVISDENKNLLFIDENNYFVGYKEPSNSNILIRKTNGLEEVQWNTSFDELMNVRYANLDAVENKIQSNIDFNENGTYIYFENLFNDYPLADRAFIKYFSMLGNQIIKSAYVDNNFGDKNGTNKFVKKSCYEFIRCVRDNEPLYVFINKEKYSVYYNDLSYEAKNALLNIVWANYTPLNSYPKLYKEDENREESLLTEFKYNDELITKADVADIIANAYNELTLSK